MNDKTGMINEANTIPTYIINITERRDRLEHIKQQFSDKPEFNIEITEAVKHSIGSVGLWQSTLKIVEKAQQKNQDYILICEDDHQFTDNYSFKKLQDCIIQAQKKNADVLLGGIHWFNSVLRATPKLFWVDIFTATHFVIIYNKFFDTILSADFGPEDASDLKIADLTDNKLVIYPFIATQKEFGYSDITPNHSKKGHINSLFKTTSSLMRKLDKIYKFYQSIPITGLNNSLLDYNYVNIPTYILSSSDENREHVMQQFKNKHEFDIEFVFTCKNSLDSGERWNIYRDIINLAIENEHEIIVISEDDHIFTSSYSWEFLFRNILEAHQQGADMLYGTSGDFGLAIPITAERFWVNQLLSTQFVVIYKNFFIEILRHQPKEHNDASWSLSNLTNNKMLLCPTISIKKESDASELTQTAKDLKRYTKRASKRMRKINEAYLRYASSTNRY